MSALILTVEDEPQLAEVLEASARQEVYLTGHAADGVAALPTCRAAHLALVRRKLDAAQAGGLLHTVRGVGSRLEVGA